jgi:PGF-CTERM protein
VISYAGEERLHSGGKVIEGIGSLPPTYAESAIEFHRFERRGGPLPTISYSVANVSDDDVTLSLGTFLTNGGTEPAGDLTLILLARQADSNVVADRATVHVGQVRPGRTISAEADLTVPEDYNYYLVGLLKRDGVIVDTAQSAANLDPSRTIADPNETTEEVPFNAGDFEESDGESNVGPETTTETGGGSGPGFGVGVALVALLALAALAAGRNRP